MTSLGLADMPARLGRRPAMLALQGALLDWLLQQPRAEWPALLDRIAAAGWRARLEAVDQEDGPDLRIALEVERPAGWVPILRIHRETLGLARLDADQIAQANVGAP